MKLCLPHWYQGVILNRLLLIYTKNHALKHPHHCFCQKNWHRFNFNQLFFVLLIFRIIKVEAFYYFYDSHDLASFFFVTQTCTNNSTCTSTRVLPSSFYSDLCSSSPFSSAINYICASLSIVNYSFLVVLPSIFPLALAGCYSPSEYHNYLLKGINLQYIYCS